MFFTSINHMGLFSKPLNMKIESFCNYQEININYKKKNSF